MALYEACVIFLSFLITFVEWHTRTNCSEECAAFKAEKRVSSTPKMEAEDSSITVRIHRTVLSPVAASDGRKRSPTSFVIWLQYFNVRDVCRTALLGTVATELDLVGVQKVRWSSSRRLCFFM